MSEYVGCGRAHIAPGGPRPGPCAVMASTRPLGTVTAKLWYFPRERGKWALGLWCQPRSVTDGCRFRIHPQRDWGALCKSNQPPPCLWPASSLSGCLILILDPGCRSCHAAHLWLFIPPSTVVPHSSLWQCLVSLREVLDEHWQNSSL